MKRQTSKVTGGCAKSVFFELPRPSGRGLRSIQIPALATDRFSNAESKISSFNDIKVLKCRYIF
jgi:hypothetical protein